MCAHDVSRSGERLRRARHDALRRWFGGTACASNDGFGGGTKWPCPICLDQGEDTRPLTLRADGALECLNDCKADDLLEVLGLSTGEATPLATGRRGTSRSEGTVGGTPSPAAVLPMSDKALRPGAHEDEINGLALREEVVADALRVLGADAHLGAPLRLPLIADGPIVAVRDEDGTFRFHGEREGVEVTYSLADARAALGHGRIVSLSPALKASWYRRVFHEAGWLVPASVSMRGLPDDASDLLRAVHRGFGLHLGLRWLTHPSEPAMFARDFAAAWCEGVRSEDVAANGVRALRRLGVIRKTGMLKRSNLYLPMTGR